MATPAQRFWHQDPTPVTKLRPPSTTRRPDSARGDGIWVTRRASAVGVVMVSWQQVCLGVAAAGHNIDVWVTDQVLQFYDGDQPQREKQKRRKTATGEESACRATRTSRTSRSAGRSR